MKNKLLTVICIIIAVIILTEPQIVTAGMKKGIELSVYSVIPALFPFMLLTNYMICNNLCQYISYVFYPLLSKIFPVSKNGCFAVLIGFTGGYPMGAKTINDLYERNLIGKEEGKYLCTFCNNCSLSFLLNYVVYTCLNHFNMTAGLSINVKKIVALVYLPAILVGIINGFFFRKPLLRLKNMKHQAETSPVHSNNVIRSGINSILNLCVYVICFSVLAEFVNHLTIPSFSKCIMVSLIEITSGCMYTSTHLTGGSLQLFILLFSCVFGGLSITLQSITQFKEQTFTKYYFIGKLETLTVFVILFLLIS